MIVSERVQIAQGNVHSNTKTAPCIFESYHLNQGILLVDVYTVLPT